MGHIPILDDLAVIAGLGVLVAVVLSRLKLPTMAGLLLAGALAGPGGLGLVQGRAAIDVVAELGVVLLLFTVGLELPIARLRSMLKHVAGAGALQVGLTTAVVTAAAMALGEPLGNGIFYGFIVALSSTAIVLRAVSERRDIDAPHGRMIVGILIFQDLCLVPMALLVPVLGAQGGGAGEVAASIGLVALKLLAVVAITVLFTRLVAPVLLNWVASSRSEELFLFAVLGLCMGAAWATQRVGLSLALGAFLGGLAVAGTRYGHRALGSVLPLRDAFVSVFFVSLGMLFDAQVVFTRPLLVLAITAMLVLGKGLLATLTAVLMRSPPRVAWLTGVALAQFGEFGFVLSQLGEQHGVVTREQMGPVLSAGVLSMFLTPVLVRLSPSVTVGERVLAPVTKLLRPKRPAPAPSPPVAPPSGHVVLVGYGLGGRLLAQALKATGRTTVALELNAKTVQAAQAAGEHVLLADATSPEALHQAHLERARALVVVMNDPAACKRVLDTAKRVAPTVPVLVRTRFLNEKAGLLSMGASDVVAEEVEGAVEVLVRVLRWMEVPRNDIERRVKEARVNTQTSEATLTVPRRSLGETAALADLKLEQLLVEAGSAAEGRCAVELDLRRKTGCLLVAVHRGGQLVQTQLSELELLAGDRVYVAGPGAGIKAALLLVSPPPPPNKEAATRDTSG